MNLFTGTKEIVRHREVATARLQDRSITWKQNKLPVKLLQHYRYIRDVIKKLPLFSNFVSYVCSIFAFLFFYLGGSHHPFWIVSLFLKDKNVCHVWVCSSIFDFWKKWIKETVLSFMEKMKLNVQTFEILTVAFGESTRSRTQVKLWYNRFKKRR